MTSWSIGKRYVVPLLPQPTLSSSLHQAVKLPVRENESGQVFVANLSTVPLDTFQDFNKVFG